MLSAGVCAHPAPNPGSKQLSLQNLQLLSKGWSVCPLGDQVGYKNNAVEGVAIALGLPADLSP